ncbi:MAG: sulfate permease [Spirochaetia bacterium]|nr:sulfate permease [Spirochaetia bacterium]
MYFKPAFIQSIREGYKLQDILREFQSGVTVGIVALPLAMAFSIASGLSPERGLYTAIIGGFLISALGGSRVQIGGPTGAFIVVIFGIVQKHGYEGLIIATIMAGIMLIISGLFRFGRMVKFMPYPVVTGFTAGIAAIIFSTQINDFLGFRLTHLPANFTEKWIVYIQHLGQTHVPTLLVGAGSLIAIAGARKYTPRIPGPLLAILFSSIAVSALNLNVETIGDRFGVISADFPPFEFPEIVHKINFQVLRLLFPDAFTIAFLAGVESLLSAVVADGMSETTHDSDTELTAQGIANIVSVSFGGIPVTGAIARTATNIKNGAKTPLSGIAHALTVLLFTLILAPYASAIPLTALAAVLFVVAWHMSEINHFIHMFKAPRSDSLVMILVFFLTIFVDLTAAVEVGIVLSALLFMRRMSDMAGILNRVDIADDRLINMPESDAISKKDVPEGVVVYEIQGPFFFGVADLLKGILAGIEDDPKVMILRMRKVSVVDATGAHALSEFHYKCRRGGTILILSGVSEKVLKILVRMGIAELISTENIAPNIDTALKRASQLLILEQSRSMANGLDRK